MKKNFEIMVKNERGIESETKKALASDLGVPVDELPAYEIEDASFSRADRAYSLYHVVVRVK
jgi:hypothetical protein